ncbi:MAG: hypothetical protein HQ526_04040 [Actinobacteria bacterium]|nr:hypothetical protein [Actinomycetota bacterium]
MADQAALHMRHAEVVFLASYLNSLTEWDARAAVRIVQRDRVVGFFGAPPTGCITFIAVPLSSAGEEQEVVHSRTVSAGRMRDVLGDVSLPPRGFAGRRLRVPDPVTGPLELLTLPPLSGWERTESTTAEALGPLVEEALGEFRRRVPQDANIEAAAAQRVAEEIWSRPALGDVPVRAVHTAHRLGFLNKDTATVDAAQVPGWTRLATPSGQVFTALGTSNLTLGSVTGR